MTTPRLNESVKLPIKDIEQLLTPSRTALLELITAPQGLQDYVLSTIELIFT